MDGRIFDGRLFDGRLFMEDFLWKTFSMEDFFYGRLFLWKTFSMERIEDFYREDGRIFL